MVEVAKPDYLSLVNKGGSGFNISELVDSIVAAEIEPKKTIQSSKKEKNTEAISGIGFLNSKASVTKTGFANVTADKYFNLSSSNTSAVEFTATDEMKLSPSQNEISDIEIAKKMVFEMPGFTDLTTSINQTLTLNYGSWVKTGTAGSDTNSFSSGKTYLITSAVPALEKSNIANNSDLANDAAVVTGAVFTASGNGTTTAAHYKEVEKYTFTAKSGNTATTVNLTGTLENSVKILDAVSGISAKLVKTSSTGTPTYSIVITSDTTGAENGFQFSAASNNTRWETSTVPSSNSNGNTFSQLSKDATLKVDNVSITRSSNTISDIIDGVEINLKADNTSTSQLNVSRSKANVKASVETIIASMNDFKNELDRLTFIDIEGDNNGPLAMDPTVTRLESNFKKLMVEPLSGYGADGIYLSQLGIKTNADGNFYFDTLNFEKAFSNNPQNFNALKDANLTTSSVTAAATKSTFTKVDPGVYQVSNDGTNWKFGTTVLSRVDYNGGSRFTSISYPGLVIDTAETNPSAFNVYVGKSLSQKVSDFMDTILSTTSSVKTAETTYKTNNSDIEKKLVDLEQRETMLKSRYTEQFGAMEQAMTQFNSTQTLLDNFIEGWKKQK